METAPKSDSTYSATSSEPAAIDGLSCGTTTRRKVANELRPSVRLASSRLGSSRL
jgi:hypothetical protein